MRNQRQQYAQRLERAQLSSADEETLEYLRLIVDEGTLGASKHVKLIQELFLHLSHASPPHEAWHKIELAGSFITQTRGAETPIIANSIRWLLRGLEEAEPEEIVTLLQERTEAWARDAQVRSNKLTDVAVALLGGASTLLTFDYSSTVATAVKAVHKAYPETTVIVPESRAIGGGAPYLREFANETIRVHYVADMALEFVVPKATAVLLGVESLRCDGSFLNTIGSRLVARVANARGVPVYGCTDLYKLDLRSYRGHLKTPALKTFDERLLQDCDIPKGAPVETTMPELEVISPERHNGFITDVGLLPPQSVWAVGRETFPEVKQDE